MNGYNLKEVERIKKNERFDFLLLIDNQVNLKFYNLKKIIKLPFLNYFVIFNNFINYM